MCESSDFDRFPPLNGRAVPMISSREALLNHEPARYLWYPLMSLWHTTTSHFHKNIFPQAPMAGNDAKRADNDSAADVRCQ